nr:tRNA uracil 4-sulfurtransferase ThiI [Maliibacterium massiliense]
MEHVILVRFGEIHLKGQNRPYFEKMLMRRLKEAAAPYAGARVEKADSRYFVRGIAPQDMEEALARVCRVFGVHSACPAVEMEKDDFTALCAQAAAMMPPAGGTFKVKARRSDKRYPMDSQQIAIEMGGYILEHAPAWQVDIHDPQLSMCVEIRDRAYLYNRIVPAQGGMPVGSNGKAFVLMSGGIDSPVAAWMVAKRGLALEAVHFFSPPYTSARARQKVVDLVAALTDYCGPIRLHVVPFTEIQQKIYEKGPEREMTVLMRRSMMRIAERIARCGQGQALVTGESIGQVASQTVEALGITNNACTLPVFRPLIAFDKAEIMEKARAIGTYETSILPYEDCCTVFVPRHPATHPKLDVVLAAEAKIELAPLEDKAMEQIEVVDVRPRGAEA